MKHLSLQTAVCAALAVAFTPSLHAVAPTWWAERGVVPVGVPPDDYHLVNQGQLKNFALGAWVELQAKLPGGAGAALTALVSSWTTPGVQTDDFATVNRGQLKNLAKGFYLRLAQVGYHWWGTYPWTNMNTGDDDDFAYANIGQVKNVFSFDLRPDADGDGMPDWWEILHLLNKNNPDDAVGNPALSDAANQLLRDPDQDGLFNLQEYQAGLNPRYPYSGGGLGDYYAAQDLDGDGLSTAAEQLAGSNPTNADTDGDGYWDGADAFPTDPNLHLPLPVPGDVTPPVITIFRP